MTEEEKKAEEGTKEAEQGTKEQETDKNPNKEQTSVQTLINDVKQQYEQKLLQQKAEADKAIKERDEVIKQLLAGESTATTPTIADKINSARKARNTW